MRPKLVRLRISERLALLPGGQAGDDLLALSLEAGGLDRNLRQPLAGLACRPTKVGLPHADLAEALRDLPG
ncbi:MAG: hypothetical protein M3304_13790, partial [Actinomycetota bacterium]|nr:hypothetical protein [Actinomycetota bacterium]